MFDSVGSPITMPWDVSRGISPGGGKVFYVRELAATPGSDSNEGTDPDFPLLKIQAAIDKCTTKRHDYIFVQDAAQADVVSILLNKEDIHLIGLGDGSALGGRARVDMQGVDAAFKSYIEGGGFELAGFQIGSVGDACIELASTTFTAHIHHCAFGHYLAAKYGIYSAASVGSPGSWVVDHCFFGQYMTHEAINVEGSSFCCYNHNYFEFISSSQRGIFIGGGKGHILGNVFFSPVALALAEGWAIYLYGRDMMVAGNKASACGDASGNNPYHDESALSAATLLNGWADNFDGPALSGGPGVQT